MTSASNNRFNAEAAAWDANPDVHKASEAALQALLQRFQHLKALRDRGSDTVDSEGPGVLEIGCGTGLLTLRVAPYAQSVVAVDAATGMIDALRIKLQRPENASFKNIHPLNILLVDPDAPELPPSRTESSKRRRFDLVLSHLVLHHITDLKELLKTMYGCLKPGGSVALTDFEDFGPEARKFHPEAKMAGVERHGINRQSFQELMREVGFTDVDVTEGFRMTKDVERFPGEWGQKKPSGDLEQMEFPFLLCVGKKPT
ncbi:MAG: hypothetical protein Q9159_007213 [Coniocarpon cinnabarinum]